MHGAPLFPFLSFSCYSFPTFPAPTYSPPCPPLPDPESGSIITSPRRGRVQSSSTSFSKKNETKNRVALLSSSCFSLWPSSFSLLSSFPSYSPCYPPSPPPPLLGCVYCCMFPTGLIVVFVCFLGLPARLPCCVRCSAPPFVELPVPWPPCPRG